jgi:hypothetical protein
LTLKVIHRLFFGFDGSADPYLGYLETWKKELPEYEIRHWNAENLPMELNDYVRRLHAAKDHAFLSDYFRWWLLREHGGIYLDADVEVIDGRKFNSVIEDLESSSDYDSVIGIDEASGGWFTAHSMASKAYSDLAEFMCEVYERMGPLALWRRKIFYFMAPQLVGLFFTSQGVNSDGMGSHPGLVAPTIKARTLILPQDYFSPVTPRMESGIGSFEVTGYTDNTSICHHFSGSWHTPDSPYYSAIEARKAGGNILLAEQIELMSSYNSKSNSSKFLRVVRKLAKSLPVWARLVMDSIKSA